MRWKPYDIVILLLTATICGILVHSSIYGYKSEDSPEFAKIVAGVIGSLISIISMYIGAMVQKKFEDK